MVTLTEDLLTSLSIKNNLPLKRVEPAIHGADRHVCYGKVHDEWLGSILYSSAARAEPQTATTANSNPRILRIE